MRPTGGSPFAAAFYFFRVIVQLYFPAFLMNKMQRIRRVQTWESGGKAFPLVKGGNNPPAKRGVRRRHWMRSTPSRAALHRFRER